MKRLFIVAALVCSVELLVSTVFADEVITSRLSVIDQETAFSPTAVSDGPAGTFTITATYKNISPDPIVGLFFRVVTLTGGNVLLNRSGGAGGTGSTLTVPFTGDYSDGVLSPGGSVKIDFVIGLATQAAFQFIVDALIPPTSPTADTVRFLEQSTFGPTNDLIAHVQQVGFESFLNEQADAPTSGYPDLSFWPQTRPTSCTGDCQRDNYTLYQLQLHFFSNALTGEDQLRQRVAFALSEILVVSAVDVPLPSWMRGYQQLLYKSAFGNFRQLLHDVTLNPAMGRFLSMVNNRCQTRTPPDVTVCRNGVPTQPNENYAREILQLFSIGTFMLNADGTRQVDGNGNPIPTYDQNTVEQFARVFTGWVLAPALAGPSDVGGTVPNYRDPMVVHKDSQGREDWHDQGAKTLLNGAQLPAGQSAEQDLNSALENIVDHPNVAPFISKQLIQHLVTSNPSPAYVARVAGVFSANSNSDTQLFEVVKAILLDPEARGDSKDPQTLANYGKLREPAQFITNVLRAFNAQSDGVLDSLNVGGSAIGSADMGEDIFNAPSVFNFFPPTARIAGEGVLGPEFVLFSSLTTLTRDNFVNRVIFSTIPPAPPNRPTGTSIDLSPWTPLASDPGQLVESLNELLLHGTMSYEMYQTVTAAVTSVPIGNALARVRSAAYLILTSPQYQVQR